MYNTTNSYNILLNGALPASMKAAYGVLLTTYPSNFIPVFKVFRIICFGGLSPAAAGRGTTDGWTILLLSKLFGAFHDSCELENAVVGLIPEVVLLRQVRLCKFGSKYVDAL